jgi:hypothetical protein
MDDTLTRIWVDLVARLTGPFAFRFILQPVMGLWFAARDGVHDAQEGRPPYFWTLFTHHESRSHLLPEGFQKVRRVILLGIVMEVAYQLIVLRWIYLGEMILMVIGLACLPYLLTRGAFNRIARHWIRPKGAVAL